MNKIELLMSAKKYGVVSKEYLQSKLYEKYSHTFSINDCVLAAELVTNSILITKDNIHLYYEYMSDEELEKYSSLIWIVLSERHFKIIEKLQVDKEKIYSKNDNTLLFYRVNNFKIGFSWFGAKDTLKPIYQYITEIKASEKYLTYLIKQYYDFCEIKELQKGYYELVDIGSNKLILNGCLDDIMEYINNAKNYKDLA